MTRWLVTGAAGMLGRDLTALLSARNEEFTALARADLDLTDADAVTAAVAAVKPDVVVNCAAWTGVDAAEEHEDEALAINGHGPANLAAACASTGALLVHPSTDYVFDGHAHAPYAEDAPTAPAGAGDEPGGHELICTLLWSPSTSRCARGTRGAGVTCAWCPMREDSMRPTPSMEALDSTMEYSISLSVTVQSSSIAVNGPT